MKKITICHFILGFHNGGVEKVLENYFSHMDKSEFELHIVTHIEPDLKRQNIFENMGFQIHQLSRVHGSRITAQNIKEYKKLFESYKFDIIHNHFPENPLPLFFAKRYGIKCRILHSHSDYQTIFENKSLLIKKIYNIGLKLNVNNATHCFACGEKAGESVFGKKNMGKVVLIHNAIDTSLFCLKQTKRDELRKQLGLTDSFVLGHVGRYEIKGLKNQEFILEIFQQVIKKIPSARLLMLGEGKYRSSIMQQAENMGILNKCIFTGAVTNVQDYLFTMDVFVFPSLFEGLSVAAIEAQCTGLPVVASDTVSYETGITDLCSFFSLKYSAEKWADEVISKMKIRRMDQSENIKKAGYEINHEAKKLENIYKEIYYSTR